MLAGMKALLPPALPAVLGEVFQHLNSGASSVGAAIALPCSM